MIKKIINSPLIMNWFSIFIQFGSAVFLLPLILSKFSSSEVSIWLLFSTLLTLVMLADSGFGPTLTRSISFFISGEKNLPNSIGQFNSIQSTNTQGPNFKMLKSLLYTSGVLYLFLSFFGTVLIGTFGTLSIWNLMTLANHRLDLWITFGILIVNSFISIQTVRWNSFLQGLGMLAQLKRFESLMGLIKIVVSISLLTMGFGILSLFVVNLMGQIVLYTYSRITVLNGFQRVVDSGDVKLEAVKKFDLNIIKNLWPATWRVAGVSWGGFLIANASSLLVAQVSDTNLIASYLFTIRVVTTVSQVAQATILSYIPTINQYMSNKNFDAIKEITSKIVFLGLSLQILSMLSIGLFGNEVLQFMNIDTRLISWDLLLIIAITSVLELHHSTHSHLYMTSNQVPFLIPNLGSGILILIISYISLPLYGLKSILLTQMLVQMAFNNWYSVYLSLKLLKWSFSKYCRDVMVKGPKLVFNSVFR